MEIAGSLLVFRVHIFAVCVWMSTSNNRHIHNLPRKVKIKPLKKQVKMKRINNRIRKFLLRISRRQF